MSTALSDRTVRIDATEVLTIDPALAYDALARDACEVRVLIRNHEDSAIRGEIAKIARLISHDA